jgi:two-component system, sensor histidine kinase and response regulator
MKLDLRSPPWWTRLESRRALWLALALWTALAAALTWWLIDARLRDYRQQTLTTAAVRVKAVKETLTFSLHQLAALPRTLAHLEQVRAYAAAPRKPVVAGLVQSEQARAFESYLKRPEVGAMNAMFDTLSQDLSVQLVGLVDDAGDLIASSETRTASGQVIARNRTNLSSREYFAQAMAQGSAVQFLTGQFTKAPGLYFSSRIDVAGKPVGVAVVKQDLAALNSMLSDPDGSIVFVSDTNGVVVLSNRSELLLHRLPGAPERPEAVLKTLYQAVPERMAWATAPLPAASQVATATTVGGLKHVTLSSPLGNLPFTVWVLDPLEDEHAIAAGMTKAAVMLWLLGGVLILVAWRATHWLDAALQARRELLDMAQALPLTVFRYEQPPGGGAGRFSFLGRGVAELFGVQPRVLEEDPTLPWRLAGDADKRPPTEAQEFAVQIDDRATWVLAHSTPQELADGGMVYNGYWLDVSKRRETELRFAAVFEHAPTSYLFFDQQRGITHCNPATLTLFGADEAARVLGRSPWLMPLAPDTQPDGRTSLEAIREHMNAHMRSGARVRMFEWQLRKLDGTRVDAEVGVIVLDWGGHPQFCALIQDITSRKLAQAAMQQGRDAAEAASLTKSSFLANMSHELRTPMNAIIGMTHLALEDGLPARQHGYIEKANASARSLLQILNDILDVSKIEAGHLDLEHLDFELDAVINAVADVVGLNADEKGLELLFHGAPDLPQRLVGDPTRLRQVLVNLGGNAVKFTDAGEVTIGMEVREQRHDSVELHAWVRDTGPGLSEGELARIFQPFAQADNSTTRRFGGTGLGLVISRQLVERMGGRLWVESTPGSGSTFHFTARLARSTQADAAPLRAKGSLAGRRALLVDDNPTALDVLGDMLEGFGVRVDRVDSGARALDMLAAAADAYSWILIDWMMPGMDGLTCARLILERHPQTRPCILLVTAFGRDDVLQASADLPLAGLLQKPVTPSSLHDTLLQAGRPQPATALRSASKPDTSAVDSSRRRLAGARILLVEDHPVNQELARELLGRAGMQVVVAADGQQALDMLANDGPFDGVLMDCQMPVMDGYTATQRLRANPEWKHLPVIAMTASALADDRDRALASGMNAHIAKPINVESMLRTMAQWISPRGAAPTAAAGSPGAAPATGLPDLDWPPRGLARHIDTTDGMARCAGRADLYRRVLVGFRDGNAQAAPKLQDALAAADWASALRVAHDLKGLAGTIGAVALAADAQALHDAAVALDAPAAHAALEPLRRELGAVLDDISRLLAPPDPRTTP